MKSTGGKSDSYGLLYRGTADSQPAGRARERALVEPEVEKPNYPADGFFFFGFPMVALKIHTHPIVQRKWAFICFPPGLIS